jgi:ornithine carbamoyltransferase
MKDFIAIADYSPKELQGMLDLAVQLKDEWKASGNAPLLKGKVLAMVFQKPSLRTRVSFDMAMRHMGGDALYLSPNEIGLGKRESIADIARVLAGYVEAIMARVFDHQHVVELAQWSEVPVINGLSDYNHPCQAMADALTIQENFGNLKGVQVSYIGDGNNVAVSLMHICSKLGAHFTIASPEGYDLPAAPVEAARQIASETGATIKLIRGSPGSRTRLPGHIHGYMDQHGPGRGNQAAGARLSTLPGERGPGCQGQPRSHCDALPASAPWARDHRRGSRRPPFCPIPAGSQSVACPEGYSGALDGGRIILMGENYDDECK